MLNNSDSLFYKIGDDEHELKYYYFSRVNFEKNKQSYIGELLRNQDVLENQNEISKILAYTIYSFCNLSSSKTVENIVIINIKDSLNMVSRMLRDGFNYLDNKIVDLYSSDKFFTENVIPNTNNISYEFLYEYSDNLSINVNTDRPCNIVYITDHYENSYLLVEKVKKIRKKLNVNQFTAVSLTKPTTRMEYDYVSKNDINKFLLDFNVYDEEEIENSDHTFILEENSHVIDEQKVTESVCKKYVSEFDDVVRKLRRPSIDFEEIDELNVRHNRLHNMLCEPYKVLVNNSFRLGKVEIKDHKYPIRSFNSSYGDKLYELVDGDKYTVVKHSRTERPLVVDVIDKFVDSSTVDLNHVSRRSDRLFDIFLTVTPEQNKIIRDLDFSNTLVTGPAGTGKTQVGLHKLSYILYNNLIDEPAIILPSYKARTYIKNSLRHHGIVDIPENNLLTREDFGKYAISRIYQRISGKGANFYRPLDLNFLIDQDIHSDFFNSELYASIEKDLITNYKATYDANKIKIATMHKDFIENTLDFTDMYKGYYLDKRRYSELNSLIDADEETAATIKNTIKSKEEYIESLNTYLEEYTETESKNLDACKKRIEDSERKIEDEKSVLLDLDEERRQLGVKIKDLEDGEISQTASELEKVKATDSSEYIDLSDYPTLKAPANSEYVKIDSDLNSLMSEKNEIESEVNQKENKMAELDRENTTSKEVMDTNILHISNINQEIGKLLERHDANKTAILNSKKLVEEQEGKIVAAKRTIERVEEEISSLESKIIRINTKKSITLLEEQCDSARERISESARKRDEHKRNVEHLEGEFSVISEQISELNSQIENLKNNNTELTHFIDENEKSIKQLRLDIKNLSPRMYELINIVSSHNKTRKMLICKVNESRLSNLRVEINPFYEERTELIKQIKDYEYKIEQLRKDKYNYERSIPEFEDRVKERTRYTKFNVRAAEETINEKKVELVNLENSMSNVLQVRNCIISAFDFEIFFKETVSKVYDLGNTFDYSYYLALTNLLLKFDEKLSSSIKFDYFYFDNAESLNRAEVELIKQIEDNNLLIIGDLNQCLKKSNFTDNWDSLTKDIYFKEYKLTKQLRASNSMNDYAKYYVNNKLSLSDEVIEHSADYDDLDKQLIDLVNEITASSNSHETYAIICNHQNEYDTLKKLILNSKYKEFITFLENTPNGYIPTGIVLTSIEVAQGMEFHGVATFIPDVRYEELTQIQRNKIYSSLSRATNKLFVIKYTQGKIEL